PYMISLTLSSLTPTATTEIYTLSLHDALPILRLTQMKWKGIVSHVSQSAMPVRFAAANAPQPSSTPLSRDQAITRMADGLDRGLDRKSTRLNSSHVAISYAVFCLKKKKTISKK